jgi:hypothetical protein
MTYWLKREDPPLTVDQVKQRSAEDPTFGATDAVIIGSILRTESGGASYQFSTYDGETDTPLSPDHLFETWAVMAKMLSEALPEGNRKNLASLVFEAVRAAKIGARASNVPKPKGSS